VLTTEFIHGTKVNDVASLQEQGFSLADIDNKLYTAFAEQIFHTGFVHADPHPGNVLIRKSKKNGKAELVIIDHGLYEFLPSDIRQSLCKLWKAIVLNDHPNMKRYAAQLGVKDDYRLFCIAIAQRYVPSARTENDAFEKFYTKKGPDFSSAKFNKFSKEDKEIIRQQIGDIHDRLLVILKSMPTKLMLITRTHIATVDHFQIYLLSSLVTYNASCSMTLLELTQILWSLSPPPDNICVIYMVNTCHYHHHSTILVYSLQDHEQFVEILTQRPFKLSNFAISRLNEQAMKYLTEIARNRFDNIMLTLETMPRTLLLVIRNLNTIRAIGREHGDPVNRYMVMARIATKGAFISRHTRMRDRLAGVVQLCYFEFK
ncbi:unnamed protein product, partial [Timema podura]|nr:unnamed protein product [Timema podura]